MRFSEFGGVEFGVWDCGEVCVAVPAPCLANGDKGRWGGEEGGAGANYRHLI